MKDVRPAIRALLLTNPALNAYVTSGGVSRIYPVILPQGITSPSIVQNLITEESEYVNSGPIGLGAARIQLDCWAQSADQAVELGGLAHDTLSGFSGTVVYGANSPPTSVLIRAVFKDQGSDDYDPSPKMFSRRRDYIVWFSET